METTKHLNGRERKTALSLLRRGFSIFEVAHYLLIVRGTA